MATKPPGTSGQWGLREAQTHPGAGLLPSPTGGHSHFHFHQRVPGRLFGSDGRQPHRQSPGGHVTGGTAGAGMRLPSAVPCGRLPQSRRPSPGHSHGPRREGDYRCDCRDCRRGRRGCRGGRGRVDRRGYLPVGAAVPRRSMAAGCLALEILLTAAVPAAVRKTAHPATLPSGVAEPSVGKTEGWRRVRIWTGSPPERSPSADAELGTACSAERTEGGWKDARTEGRRDGWEDGRIATQFDR